MKLTEISFPVYRLDRITPSVVDGVTFYIRGDKAQVIDDKSVPGKTLGGRRLHLSIEGVKLYKLKYALYFLADLIKMSDPKLHFIDSAGKVFKYTKNKMVPLVFRKITSITRNIGETVIEAQGIHGRHKSLYPPTDLQKYAGFLQISPRSYLLYGFFEEQHKDTRRKI